MNEWIDVEQVKPDDTFAPVLGLLKEARYEGDDRMVVTEGAHIRKHAYAWSHWTSIPPFP